MFWKRKRDPWRSSRKSRQMLKPFLRSCNTSWRLLVLALAGCASPVPTTNHPTTAETPPSISVETQQRLDVAMSLIEDKDFSRGGPALRAVIEEKGFSTLSRDTQYRALLAAAKVAVAQKDMKRGYDYMVRVNALPEATFRDGMSQLQIAARLNPNVDARLIDCLTAVLKRWPDRISQIDELVIPKVLRDAKQLKNVSALPLLQALYDAHWKLKGGFEPSYAWKDLALLLVQRGDLTAAIDVSAHVTDPYDLVDMRADRRFDAVVAANPAQFDVAAATERQLKAIELAAVNAPRTLQFKLMEIDALQDRLRYGAALAAADAVVIQVDSTNYPEKLFDDYAKEYAWILDERSHALVHEGRSDEAVEQMSKASLRVEDRGGNVSQIINLAFLYCALEQPREALRALNTMTAKASAYGDMQAQAVRLTAAVQLKDKKEVARALHYLKIHRDDAPFTYLDALIAAGETKSAAQFLIERLRGADTRQEALSWVQTYGDVSLPPWRQEMRNRRRALIARAQVQVAIEKVGRVESYALASL